MDIKKTLGTCELFVGLPEDAIAKIELICKVVSCKTGEVIINKGDSEHDLFVVPKGRVSLEIEISDNAVTETLDQAVDHEVFGEMSLVHEFRRSANAVAMEDQELIKITRDDLLSLLDSETEVGYIVMSNLAGILARRLVATNIHLRESLGR